MNKDYRSILAALQGIQQAIREPQQDDTGGQQMDLVDTQYQVEDGEITLEHDEDVVFEGEEDRHGNLTDQLANEARRGERAKVPHT